MPDLSELVDQLLHRVDALEHHLGVLTEEVRTKPDADTLSEDHLQTLDEAREVLDSHFSNEVARIRRTGTTIPAQPGPSNAGGASVPQSGPVV